MNLKKTYKYLEYQQCNTIDNNQIKIELMQKYKQRLSKILKTQLSVRNITSN